MLDTCSKNFSKVWPKNFGGFFKSSRRRLYAKRSFYQWPFLRRVRLVISIFQFQFTGARYSIMYLQASDQFMRSKISRPRVNNFGWSHNTLKAHNSGRFHPSSTQCYWPGHVWFIICISTFVFSAWKSIKMIHWSRLIFCIKKKCFFLEM